MSSFQVELSGAPVKMAIKRPTTFLSLAPVHSDSYPKAPTSPTTKSPPVSESPVNTLATEAKVDPLPTPTASRRHSSTSSVGSVRFLRLGPVHWGSDDGDDYAIVE